MHKPEIPKVADGGREWRDAWKKADPVARSEANDAAHHGRGVPRLEYAALAAGLGAREYGQLRFIGRAGAIAMASFLVGGVLFLGPGEALRLAGELSAGFFVVLAWLYFFYRRARRAKHARDLNLKVLERAESGEVLDEPPPRTPREVHREQILIGLVSAPIFAVWFGFYLKSEGYSALASLLMAGVFAFIVAIVFLTAAWIYIKLTGRQS